MTFAAGAAPEARLLLIGRGLRAFVDGYVAVLLPAYLLALGFGTWEVGLISTARCWARRSPPWRWVPGGIAFITATCFSPPLC